MFKEFKTFITRGNILELAIGVIIGGTFQKIVTSLVNDIIMPLISIFTGKVDYSSLGFTLGEVTVKYGAFLTSVIDFLIIALSIFMAIKIVISVNTSMEKATRKQLERLAKNKNITNMKKNKKFLLFKRKEIIEPEPTTKLCPFCFTEINVKATRCPNCTSDLSTISEEA